MKTLLLSPGLSLPVDAVTEKLAFLGRTSSGKTYAGTKLCEEMLEAQAHVVALDPVGKWHGLRLAKDGKSKGYAIPVFGGLYGDVALEPTAGFLVADLIVDKKINAVLDVSQFILSEQTRFAYDFATRFYQRQKAEPSAVHLFIEECQEFIPQNLAGGGDKLEAKMLHAFERMWKLGRNAGIGGSLISQRPQEINKKVLNMSECLFVFQMTGPQEKKAIELYVGEKGLDTSVVKTLPYLKQGDCHVWSPVWLDRSEVIHIAEKRTFDASATPKVGAKIVTPKELSPIDVEQIREAMAIVVERIKADDPRELKKQIAELRKELAKKPTVEKVEPEIREVYVLANGKLAETNKLIDRLVDVAASLTVNAKTIADEIHRTQVAPARAVQHRSMPTQAIRATRTLTPRVESSNGDSQIQPRQQKVLDALRELEQLGIEQPARSTVAVFAGRGPSSSSYTNDLGYLRTACAFIDYPTPGNLCLTSAGRASANEPNSLRTRAEFHHAWFSHLQPRQAAVLRVLIDNYPEMIDRDSLAVASGRGDASSSYTNDLGAMRSLGIIDYPQPGHVAATELLFPAGLT